MQGLDVETTALDPSEGDLRLVQISDGRKARGLDMYEGKQEEARKALQDAEELVAHNAVFERK